MPSPKGIGRRVRQLKQGLILTALLSLVLLSAGCIGLTSSGGKTPVLTGTSPVAVAITAHSAKIIWTTNLPSSSQVKYGTTQALSQITELDSNMVTNHSVELKKLTPKTLYYFETQSRDSTGSAVTSNDPTFTTLSDGNTNPPTVSITAPAAGATLSGTVTVSATASSSGGTIASVQFQVDGSNLGSAVTTAPYNFSWNTATIGNGNHTLTAVATDNSGSSTTSAGVSVKVNNNSNPPPPTVSITSPTAGATVSGTVTVSATASSSIGIASVQFQIDGNNTGPAFTTAPYNYSWNTTTIGNGSHTLTAVATDTMRGKTVSTGVTVNVSNSGGTQPPSVSIAFPASGATVSGTVAVSVTASSSIGIASVQIRVDGNNTGSPLTIPPYNYSWNTNSVTDGNHTLSAVAKDTAGTSATSAAVTVNVNNSTPPSGNGIGWTDLLNTHLQDVCPPNSAAYAFTSYCQGLIAAWSSGIADTARNRLILWGGGHNDYYGNELYALDLSTNRLTRLNNPSPVNGNPPFNSPRCIETLADGAPNSRHTYNGIVYIAHADRMFAWGGSLACNPGDGSLDTWTLDMSTLTWHNMEPVNGTPGSRPNAVELSAAAVYDPNSKLVFLFDRAQLITYNFDTNTYKSINGNVPLSLGITAVVDPKRKMIYLFGPDDAGNPRLHAVDISGRDPNYTFQNWTGLQSGCDVLMGAGGAYYPGLAYDSAIDRIVGVVNAGNTNSVYIFNPDTKSCVTQTYSGGPQASANTRGVLGRWQYFPAKDEFALVNDAKMDAFLFRTKSAGGGGGPTAPVISNVTAASITASGATITWNTDQAATSQVEYGTSTGYGTTTTLDPSLVQSHSQALSGLSAGAIYHYRVHSRNASNLESISTDATFTTAGGGGPAPLTISITTPLAGATVSGTVTIVAAATDTAGVPVVQFDVDGVPLGSAIIAAPYTISWDSGTVLNGAHSLKAVASDGSGNSATSSPVVVNVNNGTGGPSADADFAARCATPGVLLCYGFDDPVDAAKHFGKPDSTGNLPKIVSSPKVSGAGALQFLYPPVSTQGGAGTFSIDFKPDDSYQVGQPGSGVAPNFASGQDYYIQWRQMFDHNILTTNWGPIAANFKQIIVSDGDLTKQQTSPSGYFGPACSDDEMVMQAYGNTTPIPIVYHSCGVKDGQYELLEVYNSKNNPGAHEYQNAIQYPNSPGTTPTLKGCLWSKIAVPPCMGYQENLWMTFQIHVHVGTWYHNDKVYHHDSIVELWVGYAGQPSQLAVQFSPAAGDAGGYDLVASNLPAQPVPVNFLPQHIYGKVWLLPYITNKDPNQVNPPAHTWYDELIVASNKIPDPK